MGTALRPGVVAQADDVGCVRRDAALGRPDRDPEGVLADPACPRRWSPGFGLTKTGWSMCGSITFNILSWGETRADGRSCPPALLLATVTAVKRRNAFTEVVTWLTFGSHDTELQGSEDTTFLRGVACRGVSRLLGSGGAPTDPAGQRGSARRPGRAAKQPDGSPAVQTPRSAQHSDQRAVAYLLSLDRRRAVRCRDRGLSLRGL